MPELQISQEAYQTIVAHARSCYPAEACGLIAGSSGSETAKTHIAQAYPLTNTDASAEHFSTDPTEQLQAIRQIRSAGQTPLGNFHSHPATPARPSAEDIRLAHDPKALYLILSLAAEEPILKAFNIVGGEVAVLELELV